MPSCTVLAVGALRVQVRGASPRVATTKEIDMIRKSVVLSAALALAGSLASVGAQARDDVFWSIGIQAPLHAGVTLGTVFSNAPVYQAAPVIYAEPVYQVAPTWIQPAPVIYAPMPRYRAQPVYAPLPVVYEPRWHRRGHGQHHRQDYRQRYEGHHGQHHRDGGRPVMSGYGY